jgi:hypothetical protein
VAADEMDDQNLVPSMGKVLLSPPRPLKLWVPTSFVYRMGTGGIKQPQRDTDELWEMKMLRYTTILPNDFTVQALTKPLHLLYTWWLSGTEEKRREDKNKEEREGTQDGEVR